MAGLFFASFFEWSAAYPFPSPVPAAGLDFSSKFPDRHGERCALGYLLGMTNTVLLGGGCLFAAGILLGILLARWFRRPGGQLALEGTIMITVAGTNPDVTAALALIATDDEGVPTGETVDTTDFSVDWTSDNPSAVEVTIDESDPFQANVHFGTADVETGDPEVANVTATVRDESGVVLGVFGEQFVVTPGESTLIAGRISFGDLTSDPVEPPVE